MFGRKQVIPHPWVQIARYFDELADAASMAGYTAAEYEYKRVWYAALAATYTQLSEREDR